MSAQQPQPGLVELMAYLDSRALPKGICTRNFDAPVDHLLTKFLSSVQPFHPVVTREFRPPKPDPAGILHIARSWGLLATAAARSEVRGEGEQAALDGERVRVDACGELHREGAVANGAGNAAGAEADASGLIMVGDSIDDMTAGRRAGAATVLLVNPANEHLAEHEHTDLTIKRLDDLIAVLEDGFEGRAI